MSEDCHRPENYRLGVALPTGNRAAAAVLASDGRVVAAVEQAVAGDDAAEIMDAVLAEARRLGVLPEQIGHVMFAVTDATVLTDLAAQNGLWRGWPGRLTRVAAVRLGAGTTAVPPLALWPDELRDRVAAAATCLSGGAMLDGSDYEPLDIEGLLAFARRIAGTVGTIAITGVFSSVTPRHELAAAEVLRAELGSGIVFLLSHEFGGLGLIERENATVLQAALTVPTAEEAGKLLAAVVRRGLGGAEVFLARGDGTIATLDNAVTHPLSLLAATDACAATGVALLAGEQDALVGLTRADGRLRAVCALTAGMPRMTLGHTEVAGVPTGLSVPALVRVDGAVEEAIDRAKDAPGDLPFLLAGPGAAEFAKSLPRNPAGTVAVDCPAGARAAAAGGAAPPPGVGVSPPIGTL
ncbi:MAG: hypothetical protein ABW215_08825, partial [Kibdelosporangium sp.]